MPSVTFELKTITPLFLGGADNESSLAELRPPAFRGALRYWFRAMAAGVTSLSQIQEWEKKVFGSTDNGGAIITRLQVENNTSSRVLTKDHDAFGINYLFFSTFGGGSKPPRGCFLPNNKFKIILQSRLNNPEQSRYLQLAAGAMWLLVHLGGIGSRSNRGGGSLQVHRVSKRQVSLDNFPSFKIADSARNTNAFNAYLKQGIGMIRRLYQEILNGQSNLNLNSPTAFDILHPQTADIYLWQAEDREYNEEWDDILNEFGILYQDFRCRYKDAVEGDYPQVKNWIKNTHNSVSTVKRAAFGLPIQFYFTSLPSNNRKASVEGRQSNRSSSPFHIRAIKMGNQQYVLVLLRFKTQLLPPGEKLRLSKRGGGITCNPPNQEIIDEFLHTLTEKKKVNF